MNKLDLEETTRRFHNVYEQIAKEYGYKTREDTKELDFNSPNGMTMLKTVETITTPYLEEIERLNNELKSDENYYVRNLKTIIKEKDQEIERLNKELETLKQPQVFIDTQDMEERYGEELYKEYLEKENKRLNNIINELEKWLKEDTEKYMMTMETGRAFNMFDILDKLQELKGEDKE